jgi:hypothetical protein
MSWKRYGRKRSWPNFKVQTQHFYGGSEENPQKIVSGQPYWDSFTLLVSKSSTQFNTHSVQCLYGFRMILRIA